MLQETNWDRELILKMERIWRGRIYVSNGVNKSCGVAVLTKNNALFKNIKEIYKDEIGRQLILDLDYKNSNIRLMNSYAPNIETEKQRKDILKV